MAEITRRSGETDASFTNRQRQADEAEQKRLARQRRLKAGHGVAGGKAASAKGREAAQRGDLEGTMGGLKLPPKGDLVIERSSVGGADANSDRRRNRGIGSGRSRRRPGRQRPNQ